MSAATRRDDTSRTLPIGCCVSRPHPPVAILGL
jgi:hypothetical protein